MDPQEHKNGIGRRERFRVTGLPTSIPPLLLRTDLVDFIQSTWLRTISNDSHLSLDRGSDLVFGSPNVLPPPSLRISLDPEQRFGNDLPFLHLLSQLPHEGITGPGASQDFVGSTNTTITKTGGWSYIYSTSRFQVVGRKKSFDRISYMNISKAKEASWNCAWKPFEWASLHPETVFCYDHWCVMDWRDR